MGDVSMVPFRDLVEYSRGGGWGSEHAEPDHEPVRIIRGTDFSHLVCGDCSVVPRRWERSSKIPSRRLRHGDVILEMAGGSTASGQSTGRSLFINDRLLASFPDETLIPASFCRLLRFREEKVLPRYGYYGLQDMWRSGRARTYEHQSTGLSNFQFEYFLDAELLRLPPLSEQRAIAEVLGALDDKIEANRRAQDNAEHLARAQLARAQLEEAESEVPIGRLVERIAHIVQPTDLDESAVYVGLEHMPRGSMLLKERGRVTGLASAKAAFRPKDVLFGKLRPYFKKVVVAPSTGVCSTDILVLRPLLGDWAVATAVCASDEVIEYASAGSEGTRMPRVSWEYLARYTVPLPGPQGRQRLEALIAPLLELGMGLTVESDSLIALRDTLLPKLMSGELRVRDAERVVEDTL